MATVTTTNTRFGVPVSGNQSGILMPKLKYRFRVSMLGFGTDGTDETRVFTQNVVKLMIFFSYFRIYFLLLSKKNSCERK